jgi:hypothetical protein
VTTGVLADTVSWQTVAIALGAAGITGLLALAGTLVASRRQTASEWRERYLTAADDFSTAAGQAVRALSQTEHVIETSDEEALGTPRVMRYADNARHLVNDCVDRLARVQLLFGQDSDAATAAERVVDALRDSASGFSTYLEGRHEELQGVYDVRLDEKLQEASSALKLATAFSGDFNRDARAEVPGVPRRRRIRLPKSIRQRREMNKLLGG